MLRTSVDPLTVAEAVRKAVAAIDPMLPISDVRTQEQIIERTTVRERSFVTLGGIFSGVALLLAGIGIYGVLAYTVTRRTGEFGVRMALGATPAQIRWLSMRGMMALIACAIAIGVPVALAASRLVRNMLFGVEPADPMSLAMAAAAIAIAALIAIWVPSARAAKSDPAAALRFE